MGYTCSSTGNTVVRSVAGQPFAGYSRQGNYMAACGFLANPMVVGPVVAVAEGPGLPVSFALSQNYPNPFNPSTVIRFELPRAVNVSLKVYNMLGQEVVELMNGLQQAGVHAVRLDARNLASGAYIYRLRTDGFEASRKLMLLK